MLRFYIIMILIISSNEYSNCLKKITEIDPFKIFGIDTKWIFEDIKKKYYEISLACHPDKFPNASIEEKKILIDNMAIINGAFDIIKLTYFKYGPARS